MYPSIQHTNLVSNVVEARAYQLEAVNEALSGSTMLVLPTAAGKTAVAWMTIAEKMRENKISCVFCLGLRQQMIFLPLWKRSSRNP